MKSWGSKVMVKVYIFFQTDRTKTWFPYLHFRGIISHIIDTHLSFSLDTSRRETLICLCVPGQGRLQHSCCPESAYFCTRPSHSSCRRTLAPVHTYLDLLSTTGRTASQSGEIHPSWRVGWRTSQVSVALHVQHEVQGIVMSEQFVLADRLLSVQIQTWSVELVYNCSNITRYMLSHLGFQAFALVNYKLCFRIPLD